MLTRQRRGFTLVELLVVIGIIALLLSILIPALSKARQSAWTLQCASTLRQFATANQMYVSESRGYCLPAYQEFDPGASPTVGGGARASNWWSANFAFRRYMSFSKWNLAAGSTPDYPLITDFTPSASAGATAAFNGYLPSGFICPLAVRFLTTVVRTNFNQEFYPTQVIYGMNVEGISDKPNTATFTNRTPWAITRGSPNFGTGVFGYKMSKLRRSSEKLMFVDALCNSTACIVDESGSGVSPGTNGQISNYDIVQERTGTGALPGGGTYNATRMTAWRHRGGANVAFFDGHVSWLRKDEIYQRDASGNIIGNDKLWKVLD